MAANQWNDYLAGTDEYNVEEIMFRLQELYRLINGSPGWGRVGNFNQYDGGSFAMDIQSLEDTTSPTLFSRVFDDSVTYTQDINGNQWEGPWTFTGNGDITGNVLLTGTFHVTGAVDFDSTLNVDGAVTLQSTLRGIGAVTFDGAGTLGDAAADAWLFKGTNTFNEDSTFKKALIVEGNTTLGNAAGDTITVTGTATFAEDVTMSKGLIVDTSTLIVDETLNAVGFGVAPLNTGYSTEFALGLRVQGGGAVTASAGAGVEVKYASAIGQVVSVDRGASTFSELRLIGDPVKVANATTQKVAFYGGAGTTQQTAPTAVAASGADAMYGNTERDMINEHATAINEIITKIAASNYWA